MQVGNGFQHNLVGRKFGSQVGDYEKGRSAYSNKLLEFITNKIKELNPQLTLNQIQVLDVGCGTGISTRALYDQGFRNICGMDLDHAMLEAAREHSANPGKETIPSENYLQGNVSEIETVFPQTKFDVVTAFSAFHWFCTAEEVTAIKTVMAANSIFIASSGGENRGRSAHKSEFWQLIEEIKGSPVHNPRGNFHPIETLEACGFVVEEYRFTREIICDVETLMAKRRSFSGWCNMTEEQKIKGEPKLRELVEKQIKDQGHEDGLYRSSVEESCVIAYLKA